LFEDYSCIFNFHARSLIFFFFNYFSVSGPENVVEGADGGEREVVVAPGRGRVPRLAEIDG
jgi:hypothetical protein